MRKVSMPIKAPSSSNRPPPLAPELNAVSVSMICAFSWACNAVISPIRRLIAIAVKPMAETGCPTFSGLAPRSRTGGCGHSGTRRKHTSCVTSATCSVTAHGIPPQITLIEIALLVTWQLVTRTPCATVIADPTPTRPSSRRASTRPTLCESATISARPSGCASTAAVAAKPPAASAHAASLKRSGVGGCNEPPSANQLAALVDQRHVVVAQDGGQRNLVIGDQLFDGGFPGGFAVAHAHRHFVVEADAGFRLERHHHQ